MELKTIRICYRVFSLITLAFSAALTFAYCETVSAEDEISFSISPSSANLSITPEILGTTSQTITASTTNEDGYTITMKTDGASTDLVCTTDDSLTIPTITLPEGQSSVNPGNFGYGYGYSVDGGNTFRPAPAVTSEKGDILFETSSAGANEHVLTWGANVSSDTIASTYSNSFTIAITANMLPIEEFHHDEPIVFDGTSFLDTGIALFSEENINYDFEVKFTIDQIGASQVSLATIFSDMDESGPPYPGALFRYSGSSTRVIANANSQNNETSTNATTGDYILKREAGVISYSVDGGQTFVPLTDYYGFSYPFDTTATIGGTRDGNGNPFRLFNGTISNISIVVKESNAYAIRFNPNGGKGTMLSQAVVYGESAPLSASTFTRTNYIFDHWNTEPDDSGISYQPGDIVYNLAEPGGSTTLYAIWRVAPRYTVVFHSNTEPDIVKTQEFVYSVAQNLDPNTFTNDDAYFVGWNTAADDSGTLYGNEERVLNLTETDGATVDLYAIWSDTNYVVNGETVFDGTNYLNSGIHLFDASNVGKDFIVSFEITNRPTNPSQATMMSAMDESGSPWPGMVYRAASSGTQNELIVNATSSIKKTITDQMANTKKIRIRRVGTLIYERINNNAETLVLDMAQLARTFDSPVVFGASLKADGTPQRYFTGTLSNIEVLLIQDPPLSLAPETSPENETPTESPTPSSNFDAGVSEATTTMETTPESEPTSTQSNNDPSANNTSASNNFTNNSPTVNSTDDDSISSATDIAKTNDAEASRAAPLGVKEYTKDENPSTTSSLDASVLAAVAISATVAAAGFTIALARYDKDR